MPNSTRKPGEEFLSKRVGDANFLDLDEVASPSDLGLKHMMPDVRVFGNMCGTYRIQWQHDVHGD
jgi:thiosulfate/3-mercaptopyruvate sulfurtransferase